MEMKTFRLSSVTHIYIYSRTITHNSRTITLLTSADVSTKRDRPSFFETRSAPLLRSYRDVEQFANPEKQSPSIHTNPTPLHNHHTRFKPPKVSSNLKKPNTNHTHILNLQWSLLGSTTKPRPTHTFQTASKLTSQVISKLDTNCPAVWIGCQVGRGMGAKARR